MNEITPVDGTNVIRVADFVRITNNTSVYRFSTAPTDMTIPAIDSQPFTGLSQLVNIGSAQRDIKSTANETTVTLVGIDTAMLALVLSSQIKGALIEMWHGFFNSAGNLITETSLGWTNNSGSLVEWRNTYGQPIPWTSSTGNSGLYKFFTGYINAFSISEQFSEEVRAYTGSITVSASSIQLILQNRTAGRFTNDNAWQFFTPGDTSMNRVNFIQNINYAFGQNAPANT